MGNRETGAVWLLLVATILSFTASCTLVKENRTDCPCTLFLSLGALPDDPVDVQIFADAPNPCYRDCLDRDTTVRVWVPKRSIRVVGASGHPLEAWGGVGIPLGEDFPEVFLACREVQAVQDTAQCRLKLHKHFCTLSLQFDGPPGWGEPYSVQIRGAVNGLYPDGSPSYGAFAHTLATGESCRLPRQDPEDELWLDITLPQGVLRSFALGTYLELAGFDWTAPDLKDVSLRIDLSVTAVTLEIDHWSTTLPLDIVI
jgi:hypothetical protein